MTHKQLVAAVAEKLQRPAADVDALLGALVQAVTQSVCDGKEVCVPAFGNFATRIADERIAVEDGHRYLEPPAAQLEFNVSSLLARQVKNVPTKN